MDKDIKILNPHTNKYVSLNGTVGKKLVKQHLAGEIVLKDEDVAKITPAASKIKHVQAISADTLVIHIEDFEKELQLIAAQGTSKMYNGTIGGERFYVKDVVKSQNVINARKNGYGVTDIELAINELLASKIYTDVYGIDAIHLFLVVNNKKNVYPRYMIASKAIEIDTCEPITKDCEAMLDNKIAGTIEPFLVDCILANWDVGSRGNVGVIHSDDKKKAFRIDVGGALTLRALGQRRAYGPVPNEHEQFFNPTNKGYKLFKNLKKRQVGKMFDILENANINKLNDIKEKAIHLLNTLPKTDATKAENVIGSLDTVLKRHQYYVENKTSIKSYLFSKVQQQNMSR